MQVTHIIAANSLWLGKSPEECPACAHSTLGPKRSIPVEWRCHFPHWLCSSSHHRPLSSAQAGFLLNETEPEDVLWRHSSRTVAISRYSDRNHLVHSSGEHEWATQQPRKFHTYTMQRQVPLIACWICLELGQSKSPLKYVQGGCQVYSIKVCALQTCSYLSAAFVHHNTTSDATSIPSWQVLIPILSQAFPCPGRQQDRYGGPSSAEYQSNIE